MATKTRNRISRQFHPTGTEVLEDRQLMAADMMPGPLPLPPDLIEVRPIDPEIIIIDPDILGPLLPLPSDPLTGRWVNTNANTRGMTEIEITEDADGYHVQAWGACTPTDCDWGEVDLHPVGTSVTDPTPDYAIGEWNPGFKDVTLTLEITDDGLVADLYHDYQDGSGRRDRHERYFLHADSTDMNQMFVFGDQSLPDKILGGWVNADEDTRGLTKLQMSQSGNTLQTNVWGSCSPTDCDWGQASMSMVGSSISDTTPYMAIADYDHGFSEVFVTTRVRGSDLIAETYTVFKDGSGRSNYYSESTFWKLGDSNRDGLFDSDDLIAAFAGGEYEDGVAGNSTWEEGDWNRDGDFNSDDLLDAMACGGYNNNAYRERVLPPVFPLPIPELLPVIDDILALEDFGIGGTLPDGLLPIGI